MYSIAPDGQWSAQFGSPPQRSHLNTLSPSKAILPRGHAERHILQTIHFFSSMTRAPFSSLWMAFTGQTFSQQASSHCVHIMGTQIIALSYNMTDTADFCGLNSFARLKEQINSQLRHPRHFSGLNTMVLFTLSSTRTISVLTSPPFVLLKWAFALWSDGCHIHRFHWFWKLKKRKRNYCL